MEALVGGGVVAAAILLGVVAVLLFQTLKCARGMERRIVAVAEAAEASEKASVELSGTITKSLGAVQALLQKNHANTHAHFASTLAALGESQKADQREHAASREKLDKLDAHLVEASTRMMQALQVSAEAATTKLAAAPAELVALLQREHAAANERGERLDARLLEASIKIIQAQQGSAETSTGKIASSLAEIVASVQREGATAREDFVRIEGRLAETLAVRLEEFSGLVKGHQERLLAEGRQLSIRVGQVVAALDELKKSLEEAVHF